MTLIIGVCFITISLFFFLKDTGQYHLYLDNPDDWSIKKGFKENGEYPSDKSEVLSLIDKVKGLKLLASWVGNDANKGVLVSSAFTAPPKIGILVVGYPLHKGNELYLEQISSKEKISIISFNPRETWREITLKLPAQWKNTRVRIVALDQSRQRGGWLGISSPYSLPWQHLGGSFRRQLVFFFKLITLYPLSFLVGLIPGFYFAVKLAEKGIYEFSLSVLMAFSISAFWGYLFFWLFFFNHHAGRIAGAFLILGCLYVVCQRKTQKVMRNALLIPDIQTPLVFMFVTGCIYIALLYITYTSALVKEAATLANNRFLVNMPPDNVIPYMFSERLFNGNDPRGFLQGWLGSDRPPLQTGIVLSQRLLGVIFYAPQLHYQIIGTLLQLLWIPAVWSLCSYMRFSFGKTVTVLIFLIFSGFFLFNSVYVWPKLLAGSLGCGAFILIFSQQRHPHYHTRVILGAGLAALGMLSHGGVIFTLMAMALLLLMPSRFPGVRHTILSCVIFILFQVPWLAYQNFYEPPGNRLIKWHLGGVMEINERSVTQTLSDSYSQLSWRQYLQNKKKNINALIDINQLVNFKLDLKNISKRRGAEFFRVVNALGILNIGWLIMFYYLFKSALTKKKLHGFGQEIKTVLNVCLIATGIWLLIMFIPGSTIIHQGSYATMTLLYCALASLILKLPNYLAFVLLLAHIFNFIFTWTIPSSTDWNYFMMISAGAASATFFYYLMVIRKIFHL